MPSPNLFTIANDITTNSFTIIAKKVAQAPRLIRATHLVDLVRTFSQKPEIARLITNKPCDISLSWSENATTNYCRYTTNVLSPSDLARLINEVLSNHTAARCGVCGPPRTLPSLLAAHILWRRFEGGRGQKQNQGGQKQPGGR